MQIDSSRVCAIIPARLQSSRLPEKPLVDIASKTLVERVWNCAQLSKHTGNVVVATDSELIEREVLRFGGDVVMTDEALPSGSARVRQAILKIVERDMSHDATIADVEDRLDLVINVQGDMPFISGNVIDRAIEFHLSRINDFSVTTVCTPLKNRKQFNSPNTVKVVFNQRMEALYFSRAPIPCRRDPVGLDDVLWQGNGETEVLGFQHIGLYLYRPSALCVFSNSSESVLENVEKLEQLRCMEYGCRIGVVVVDDVKEYCFHEVNVPEDLEKACRIALISDKKTRV